MQKNKVNPIRILSHKEPEKRLVIVLKKKTGRAHSGRITVRHQGGGVKKMYRIIDFGQEKVNMKANVLALEYDPYRTAFIALLQYEDGEKRYIIAPNGLRAGDKVEYSEKGEIKIGNRMKVKNIPVGTEIHNIELEPQRGGKIVRSAGSSATVLAHEGKYTNIEMPSNEVRKVLSECFASIGAVSYPEWQYLNIRKAGNSRHRGWRPAVRGSAMNPVDHPHGGGEGRQPIGLKHPKTPWGKPALGVKTRRRKHTNKFIVSRRIKK